MVLMLIKCYCLLLIHGHLCDRGSLSLSLSLSPFSFFFSFFLWGGGVGEGVDLAEVIKELKYV